MPAIPGRRTKKNLAGYWLSTEIERTTDLRKVLEERILDSKVELSFARSVGDRQEGVSRLYRSLGEAKQLSTEPEPEPEKPVEVRTT